MAFLICSGTGADLKCSVIYDLPSPLKELNIAKKTNAMLYRRMRARDMVRETTQCLTYIILFFIFVHKPLGLAVVSMISITLREI